MKTIYLTELKQQVAPVTFLLPFILLKTKYVEFTNLEMKIKS